MQLKYFIRLINLYISFHLKIHICHPFRNHLPLKFFFCYTKNVNKNIFLFKNKLLFSIESYRFNFNS